MQGFNVFYLVKDGGQHDRVLPASDSFQNRGLFFQALADAAHLLSSLSSFVGVVTSPRKSSVFHHIEFLRLGERRVLVIMVSPDGDVQNRLVFTAQDLTQSELVEASNRLNSQYAGLSLDMVRDRLRNEMDSLRTEIAGLMSAAVDVSAQGLQQQDRKSVV